MLAALFFAGLLCATSAGAAGKNSLAPEFTLKSLNGPESSLGDYRGRYLMINFWATWCGPCKMEMPSLEQLYRKFKDQNFTVIGISNDMFGEQVVAPFVQANHLSFPVLLDPKLDASKRYGVTHLPTTFLVDPEGRIIGRTEGGPDWFEPATVRYFENLLSAP